MNAKKTRKVGFTLVELVVVLIIVVILVVVVGPLMKEPTNQDAPVKVGAKVYTDGNLYFTVFPPKGWKQKNFPGETIRSKVEFIDPQHSDVNIRVIVAPLSDDTMTTDEFLDEIQDKIRTMLTPRFPGMKWSAHKEMVVDREAVIMTCSGQGNEQRIVQFISKGLNYSVALSAASRQAYLRAEPELKRFLDSFIILEGGRALSDADRKAAQVARYRRIAILREQQGAVTDALVFVDEGLSIDPNNVEMKEIRSRLLSKH